MHRRRFLSATNASTILNGNSVDAEHSPEKYSTAYKTTPDVEDINQDYTLNEYEKYYQYRVRISPDMMNVGQNFIVDKRENTTTTRDGNHLTTRWYLFRIPVEQYEKREGNISEFLKHPLHAYVHDGI